MRLLGFLLAGCGVVGTELLPPADGGDCAALPTLGALCASDFSASHHRFALCSCDALELRNFATSAFDSNGGASPAIASVGTNGSFRGGDALKLAGALWAGAAVTLTGQLETSGSLHAGGTLSATAEVEIHADTFVVGDVRGPLAVAGTLHVNPQAVVEPTVQAQSTVREAVSVPPPCECAPPELAAPLAAAAQSNDDARIGLAPGTLHAATLDLPCGVYYVDSIDAPDALVLRVHGRVALMVAHDVTLHAGLSVALDGGAELDLVVGGALLSAGAHDLGSPAAPARTRVWIASSSTVTLAGDPTLHAVLTAPQSLLSAPDGLTVEGALLVGGYQAGRSLLRYDRAILSSGASCGKLPQDPIP
jgi:hypothetical protein